MNIQEIREKIASFHKNASQMRRFYQKPTYMGLLNVGRREDAHSHFLSWLFSETTFNQSSPDSPMMHLLDVAVHRANMQNKIGNGETKGIKDSLANHINSRRFTILETKCILEDLKKENSGKSRRSDIIIESKIEIDNMIKKLNICIENKVLSSEHTSQTKAYADIYRAQGGEWIFLFLTPLSSVQLDDYDNLDEGSKCDSVFFIQINYQDILDFILEPLLKTENSFSQNYFIIDDYINTLRYPVMEEKETKKTIMAIGEEESRLLNEFWEGNHELIELAVLAIKQKGNEDIRNNAEDLFNAIQNLESARKDKTKFKIVRNDNSVDDNKSKGYSKSQIAKKFAEELCKRKNCTEEGSANKAFKEIITTSKGKVFDNDATHKTLITDKVYLNTNIWGLNTDCWQKLSEFLSKEGNEFFMIKPIE